ncbi:MAG: hypothetical protein H0V29_03885 [Thermoleophilaceae bacterium]|nr:hypothetical protein [Thermoleophilaceae bacterium]
MSPEQSAALDLPDATPVSEETALGVGVELAAASGRLSAYVPVPVHDLRRLCRAAGIDAQNYERNGKRIWTATYGPILMNAKETVR